TPGHARRGDPVRPVPARGRPVNRVLVVDDEGGIRDGLRQVLEYEGWQVRTAASGGEGITICSDFHPHVVLLDVKMGGLDGLETLSRLCDLDPPATVVMI